MNPILGVHPKVYIGGAGALVGAIGGALLAQCGGLNAVVGIVLPPLLTVLGGYFAPPVAAALPPTPPPTVGGTPSTP